MRRAAWKWTVRHPDPDPQSIGSLRLTIRTFNALIDGDPNGSYEWRWRRPIYTIAELVEQSEKDLLARNGFGHKALAEVKEALAERGLSLMPMNAGHASGTV